MTIKSKDGTTVFSTMNFYGGRGEMMKRVSMASTTDSSKFVEYTGSRSEVDDILLALITRGDATDAK